MPAPLFKVEVAFAAGPNATSPSWTDISSYVRRRPPLTYSRGNTDETSQLQSGSMRFVVDNTDGRFTPGSSASTSAWGTVLKIRRQVRLSIWDGASYVVEWSGTVDDWGSGWVDGVKGLSRVTCSDRVASAGRIALPDLVGGEILSISTDSLFALYLSCSEPPGPPGFIVPTLGGINFSVVSGAEPLEFGETGPGADALPCITFANTTSEASHLSTSSARGTTSTSSISAFFRVDSIQTWSQVLLETATGGERLRVWVSDAGVLLAEVVSSTTGTVTGPFIADGGWRHIAATLGSGTLTLYVDGVSVGTAAYTGSATNWGNTKVGAANAAGLTLAQGAVAHAYGFISTLSATQVARIASAGSLTATETTGERWNRLCRIAGMSSTWTAADTGSGAILQQPTKGVSLASALQSVAELEQGYAYATTAGVLTLKAREARYNKASTLTVAPQTANPELEFTANDAYLVNIATIDSADSAGIDVRDETSVTDHGPYRLAATIPVGGGTAQAVNYGQWLVYRYKTPTARARNLTINGTTKASSITATQLLALDVNSRITLSPLTGPVPASSVQVFIDGLLGTVGDTWEVSYNTSPTDSLDGLVLDTSALDNAAAILLY